MCDHVEKLDAAEMDLLRDLRVNPHGTVVLPQGGACWPAWQGVCRKFKKSFWRFFLPEWRRFVAKVVICEWFQGYSLAEVAAELEVNAAQPGRWLEGEQFITIENILKAAVLTGREDEPMPMLTPGQRRRWKLQWGTHVMRCFFHQATLQTALGSIPLELWEVEMLDCLLRRFEEWVECITVAAGEDPTTACEGLLRDICQAAVTHLVADSAPIGPIQELIQAPPARAMSITKILLKQWRLVFVLTSNVMADSDITSI